MTIRYFEDFDTAEEAGKYTDEQLKRYHPAGYGTNVTINQIVIENKVKWRAEVSRLDSCD